MNILKKINLPLVVIIAIATILRFLHIDKPGGLWYDELVSYNEAFQQTIKDVITYTLTTDVHLPIYPAMLHFWGRLFSFSDISLRAFSAICGILTVILSYFAGKELDSKKTGLLCSGVFALNSFLIYFSQEIRLYSLQALLSTIFLLFLLKVKNNFKKPSNYIGLVISSSLVIYLYPISFVYAIAQLALFLTYLLIQKNPEKQLLIKNFVISLIVFIFVNTPLAIYLYNNHANYTDQINGYYCDFSSFLLILQNWFAPCLAGLYNNPANYLSTIKFTPTNMFFIFIPVVLSLYFIYRAIKEKKIAAIILGGAVAFIIAEIIAFQFTNFKVLSRYTLLVLPNILLLIGLGMDKIKSKKIGITLISIFFLIQSAYLVFSPTAAYKLDRNGFKCLAEMVNSTNPQKGDFIVVWNRQEILDKYVRKDVNKIGLLKNIAYTSEVMLQNESFLNKLPLETRKKLLRNYFKSDIIPENTEYIMNFVDQHMGKNQKFIITTNDYFNSFDRRSFQKLNDNDKKYKEISYNDLLTIKALLDLKQICEHRFQQTKIMKKDSYVVIVYEKRKK